MNKSAQAGIVHIALIVGLVVIGVFGVYITQNPSDIFNGTKAAANKEGSFSNLSADLRQNSATFYFTFSGSAPQGYTIDVSTSADMKQNLYRKFAQGSQSPITLTNPQSKYAQYKCNTFLYWRVNVGKTSIRSSVLSNFIDCNIGTGTTSPPSTPTPTPTPNTGIGTTSPTSACANPQTKPATVSLQGSDGSWCYDSDGNGNYTNPGYCIDNCSYKADYCEDVTAIGTNRDGYCTGTWNGTSWSQVHCEFGGYVCPSFGLVCSAGACI